MRVDLRFGDMGLDMWVAAEAMTPEMEDMLSQRNSFTEPPTTFRRCMLDRVEFAELLGQLE